MKNQTKWKREYYILPLSTEVNEAVGIALKDILGTGTSTKLMSLPGYDEMQDVYIVDSVLLKKVSSSQLRGYATFYRRREGGTIYPYRSEEQVLARKNQRAKAALKKTRLIVDPSV